MVWFWVKRFFARYRNEGCEMPKAWVLPSSVCNVPDLVELPRKQDSGELEPYVHPFEIPGNRRAALQMYGNPGDTKLSARWERDNMILVKGLPGNWNKGKGRIYCHRKAAPAIKEFLRRCELYGVLDYIETLGCFSYRHMQHNPSMPLSYHAFGVAFDINPKHNRAKRYKRGEAPKPFGEEWDEVWPKGVPELLVKAATESGFEWGGNWLRFIDNMHFQLVG